MRVEWRSVLDQLRQEIATRPAIVSSFSFAAQRRVPASDPRTMPALVQLNALTSPLFPGIAQSPIPVLLPFDPASYLEARQGSAPDGLPVARYAMARSSVEVEQSAGVLGYPCIVSPADSRLLGRILPVRAGRHRPRHGFLPDRASLPARPPL